MIINKRREALYSSASKICKTSLGLYVFATILSAPAMAALVPTYATNEAMVGDGLTNATAYDLDGKLDTATFASASNAISDTLASNSDAIATNASNITSNATQIAANSDAIATNASNITSNATQIAANSNAIATNASNIAVNSNAIAADQTAIETIVDGMGGTYTAATGQVNLASMTISVPSGTTAPTTIIGAVNQLSANMSDGTYDAHFETVTTDGAANVGGQLTAESALINGAMSVTGSATVNTLKSNAGIFVASGSPETTTFGVDANGNTYISGTLTVKEEALFKSDLTVQGDLIAQHGFVVDDNNALLSTGLKAVAANISGAASVGSLNASGTISSQNGDIYTQKGDVYTQKGDIFTADGDITGDELVARDGFKLDNNNFTVTSDGSMNIHNGSFVVDGVSGNTSVSGTLTVAKNATFNSNVTVNGDTEMNGSLTVSNVATFNSNVTVNGDTEMNGSLTVSNVATFNSNVIVNGDTEMNGTLTVAKNATFNSNVTVNGDTEMNGTLTVSNVATFNSNVTVKGELTAEQGVFVNDSNSLTADGLMASSVHSFGEMVAGGQIMVVQNPGAENEVAMFKVDTAGNVTASGTMEVAGMSKFFKDASGTFSLEVAEDAVTANKVINATQGVVFGSDTVAMTTVAQDAISAQAADANSNTLVSAAALQATRAAMNAENKSVFGDLYAVDSATGAVSYNSNALTTFGFEEGSQNVTDALLKYAENTAAAAGTTYAANGSFTNGYASATSVSYAALTGSETLAQAIGQVALNIGSATTSSNGNVLADNTVNQNLDLLDTNVGNLATITTGTIVTTNSNVTAALQDLATNTSNALGGAFTNGAWSGLVDNSAGSNGYAYSSATTVMAAINQVAANVGTAGELTQNYNGVSTSNTVNANLNSLNETIGDITTLNTELGNLTNGTETAPLNVVTALNNLDATLGKIHNLNPDGTVVPAGRVKSTTGDNSNLAMGTTVEEHLVSLDNAIGNRAIESGNETINTRTREESVAAGLEAAGNVIGDGDFTPTNYVSKVDNLSDAVRGLDSNLYRVENKLNDLRHDFKSGMASMAAMTALVPNSRSAGNTSLSLGTGAYDGHTAMAIGGFHYLTDNILLNAGFAWGNSNDTTYRMGVTWSW